MTETGNPVKGRKYPPEPLTEDEIKSLIKVFNTRARTGRRNRALVVTLWRAGLRLDEALSLQRKDIDFASHTINVMHGKGDKRRTVGIDKFLERELKAWLTVRQTLDVPPHATIFCTLKGDKLHQTYVRSMMHRLGAKAGIERRVHPHALRHAFAAGLAREGKPVHVIQRLLGHSSLATTTQYLQTIAPTEAIVAVMDRDVEDL